MDKRSERYDILYPERGTRTGARLIQDAKDHLATEYMRRNPGAEPAAIDENARVQDVAEAMDILSDAGVYTFTQTARDRAES